MNIFFHCTEEEADQGQNKYRKISPRKTGRRKERKKEREGKQEEKKKGE